MKPPVILMMLLLAASLLAHPQALTIMQAALMDEWQVPYGVSLFRLLRVLAPLIMGLWVIWRRKAVGWERVGWFALALAGGLLAVLSLQTG